LKKLEKTDVELLAEALDKLDLLEVVSGTSMMIGSMVGWWGGMWYGLVGFLEV